MWSSSNMFLKKLITNLCLFHRSTPSSSTTNNKNKPPRPVPPSFSTHLFRHFSAQPVHNDHHHPTEYEDPLDKTQSEMIKSNLNTLDASTSKSTTTCPDNEDEDEDAHVFFTSSSNHSDHLISDHHNQQPDFATAFASQRFFFSSPGHSKSLIPTPPQLEINTVTYNSDPLLLLQSAGGVPFPKYSPDPYWDFRKSMQEMVEARSKEEDDVGANWEYLHQLLTCYLTLNPVSYHECIIKAFSDMLVTFLLDKHADKDHTATTGYTRRSDGRPRTLL